MGGRPARRTRVSVGKDQGQSHSTPTENQKRSAGRGEEFTRHFAASASVLWHFDEPFLIIGRFYGLLEKIRKIDFCNAPRAKEADERLARSESVLDAYAHNVFAAQEENRPTDAQKS